MKLRKRDSPAASGGGGGGAGEQMVPGFLNRGPRHGQGDRPYQPLRNVLEDFEDFDEMIPLKLADQNHNNSNDNDTTNDEDDHDVIDSDGCDVTVWPAADEKKHGGLTSRLSAAMKKNHGVKNAAGNLSSSRDDGGGSVKDMELVSMDSSKQHAERMGSTRSLTEGLKSFLLPSAAIAADIAHYPLVLEENEGCTIDDLIREDVPLHPERLRAVAFQILVPFLVAGLGMVAAGMVLDRVQVRGWTFVWQIHQFKLLVNGWLIVRSHGEAVVSSFDWLIDWLTLKWIVSYIDRSIDWLIDWL